MRLPVLGKITFLVLLLAAISGCDRLNAYFSINPPADHLTVQVLSTRPHDPTAFTEGLLFADGELYESTGRYGQSTLREVDPQTGAVQHSVSLPPTVFGEGIALVGDHLLQLTWRERVGYIYDRSTLSETGTFAYTDDGWGMCYDGDHLYTSDGSDQITERDPNSLVVLDRLPVRLDGQPVLQVNELECVNDAIYANVWHTDNILRVDKASGRVTALIDASSLLTSAQRSQLTDPEAVLNGIAYDPQTGTFLVTGKLWPWLFEVKFVPVS